MREGRTGQVEQTGGWEGVCLFSALMGQSCALF